MTDWTIINFSLSTTDEDYICTRQWVSERASEEMRYIEHQRISNFALLFIILSALRFLPLSSVSLSTRIPLLP